MKLVRPLLPLLLCAWTHPALASHWQPPLEEDPDALSAEYAPSPDDWRWVMEPEDPERPDAGIDGTENDAYDALDPAPSPPLGPNAAGGGGATVPIPEPDAGWLLGGAWLIGWRFRQPRQPRPSRNRA